MRNKRKLPRLHITAPATSREHNATGSTSGVRIEKGIARSKALEGEKQKRGKAENNTNTANQKHTYGIYTMGVEKTILVDGTGVKPLRGQQVTIEFTGWVKDTSQPGNKGEK